jgi:proteasome lid subunit RPN8/RPN11
VDAIRITRPVGEELLRQARHAPEVECCGLLAGRDAVITRVLPATNARRSATRYEIAPEELFRLFKEMRADGLEHLGIYHSHPKGMNVPSPTDVRLAYYPEAAYVIVSPLPMVRQPVRAFRIRGGRFTELHLEMA